MTGSRWRTKALSSKTMRRYSGITKNRASSLLVLLQRRLSGPFETHSGGSHSLAIPSTALANGLRGGGAQARFGERKENLGREAGTRLGRICLKKGGEGGGGRAKTDAVTCTVGKGGADWLSDTPDRSRLVSRAQDQLGRKRAPLSWEDTSHTQPPVRGFNSTMLHLG